MLRMSLLATLAFSLCQTAAQRADEPSSACLGSGVRGGRVALRVEGDAGLRVRRNAVARLDGGRPDIGGEFEGCGAQLFGAGSGDARKSSTSIGARMRVPRSSSRKTAASRWRFRSSGTRRSTARCSPRGRADGGQSFAELRPITASNESQRFAALGLDADGSVFAAWIDKRNRVPAQQEGRKYEGAGLFFASSKDGGAVYAEARLASDNTCECCRLGLAFAGPGRPVVVFQEHLRRRRAGSRGHDVRRSGDAGRGSPRQQRRLADLRVPASWAQPFDLGRGHLSRELVHQRQGPQGAVLCPLAGRGPHLFRSASARPRRPQSHAAIRADRPRGATMVWKEFDGEKTSVNAMTSHDEGKSWSKPVAIATTTDTSDHPLLVSDGQATYLSWMTKADGYRLLPIGDGS